ncbi:uncharacterized protein TM35_000391730 [Trypanosoma theileri]|uniref:SRP9 domain-containing protein n=1 Tax=Trypanosoma theileri TaxID=67003 RepID=A0A1X0NLF8_9TRYP|nr:uncharacterized protein TM35_000391730 [Trypanosoma theileri]ORC84999.1 hypothetical protein TM35_000391730 [Trypanosoma theileri]
MVKLGLKEFAEATRRMVQLSGVKKSRLMLRVRPNKSQKTFILKSTDGRTTLTTQIAHQGELKMVEGIVNDFVSQCTAALVPPAPKTNNNDNNNNNNNNNDNNNNNNNNNNDNNNKGGGKSGGKAAGGSNTNQQQQQQQGNKKKKGGRR